MDKDTYYIRKRRTKPCLFLFFYELGFYTQVMTADARDCEPQAGIVDHKQPQSNKMLNHGSPYYDTTGGTFRKAENARISAVTPNACGPVHCQHERKRHGFSGWLKSCVAIAKKPVWKRRAAHPATRNSPCGNAEGALRTRRRGRVGTKRKPCGHHGLNCGRHTAAPAHAAHLFHGQATENFPWRI